MTLAGASWVLPVKSYIMKAIAFFCNNLNITLTAPIKTAAQWNTRERGVIVYLPIIFDVYDWGGCFLSLVSASLTFNIWLTKYAPAIAPAEAAASHSLHHRFHHLVIVCCSQKVTAVRTAHPRRHTASAGARTVTNRGVGLRILVRKSSSLKMNSALPMVLSVFLIFHYLEPG